MEVFGYGALKSGEKLKLVKFNRESARENEIEFELSHCGICHSDLHFAHNDWGMTEYPCVPGHELSGKVTNVGDKVSKFKVGDRIGVGCIIDSCGECDMCKKDLENYCKGPRGATMTYGGTMGESEINTYGGYSTHFVVKEDFAITIPDKLESEYVGPILCAGITVYSPMKNWELQKGQTLGVAGIGGLGHMAIKIGKALGAEVVALTRSEDKKDKILEMGADKVIITKNDEEMEKAAQSIDLMINTIPVAHDISPYIPLMKHDGNIVIVGNLEKIPEFESGPLVFNRISIAGSLIGGIKETQEVIDLCAKHDIRPEIKKVKANEINDVFSELKEGSSSNYRHVIEIDSLKEEGKNKDAEEIKAPLRYAE
ncbi:MAG: hydroxyacid dehydrogenase [Halobacteriovoraceae bacterium]|nr:hydroxyacid dehydrogenase [Halobacteriovoraceae bacterium]